LGVPPPPQVVPLPQVPQLSVPPQPSEMAPQFLLEAEQVVGVHATHALVLWLQVIPPVHPPQSMKPPHPSGTAPHWPLAQVVAGVQQV
jgi:hypothetical protein